MGAVEAFVRAHAPYILATSFVKLKGPFSFFLFEFLKRSSTCPHAAASKC